MNQLSEFRESKHRVQAQVGLLFVISNTRHICSVSDLVQYFTVANLCFYAIIETIVPLYKVHRASFFLYHTLIIKLTF